MAPVLSFGMCRLTYSSASPVLAPVSGNVKKKYNCAAGGRTSTSEQKTKKSVAWCKIRENVSYCQQEFVWVLAAGFPSIY